jgi:hypothetical protein
MHRAYELNTDAAKLIVRLKTRQIAGCIHVHRPTDAAGKPARWTDAISDGINFGWFDGRFLLFRGNNSEDTILTRLRQHGIEVDDLAYV